MAFKRIVLTGGPSAGKTTLLDLLQRQYGSLLAIAPEAASILFRGGFPRPVSFEDRIHTQRSIYGLQKELETGAHEKCSATSAVFCDRGALDGAAYWPGSPDEFCVAMDTTLEHELARYTAVIHLQAAHEWAGYTNTAVRTETPAEAERLDRRIGEIWSLHPGYIFVPNGTGTFADKLNVALRRLRPFLPAAEAVADPRLRFATAADLLD